MFRFIRSLFHSYDTGYEYWVRLGDIQITPQFQSTKIGSIKYKRKWQFYRRNGYCESKIILDKSFVLLDGYSSYKILKSAEGLDAKVPVYFVETYIMRGTSKWLWRLIINIDLSDFDESFRE